MPSPLEPVPGAAQPNQMCEKLRTCVDAPPVQEESFGTLRRVVGCRLVSGLDWRPFICRGLVWEFRDPVHFTYRALKALCPELVFPILSRRLLRHASVRSPYTFDSLRPRVYAAAIAQDIDGLCALAH
jgi:hypothetical protein